ncbi:RNA 2'-phosphotransferase [Nonomuraea sp. NPDC050556]|uniref:RNA 2'-phosphotransferase n=1 Tax=Nonomuraea sp. NPDC050556 TaxID=3364369 RepID=UPI00378CDF19
MNSQRMVRVSKYLARHLRHAPEEIGISLDQHGWVEIDDLVRAAGAHGFAVTRDELEQVVAENDKRRYVIEGTRIRASQGHSSRWTSGWSLPYHPSSSTTGPSGAASPRSCRRGCCR